MKKVMIFFLMCFLFLGTTQARSVTNDFVNDVGISWVNPSPDQLIPPEGDPEPTPLLPIGFRDAKFRVNADGIDGGLIAEGQNLTLRLCQGQKYWVWISYAFESLRPFNTGETVRVMKMSDLDAAPETAVTGINQTSAEYVYLLPNTVMRHAISAHRQPFGNTTYEEVALEVGETVGTYNYKLWMDGCGADDTVKLSLEVTPHAIAFQRNGDPAEFTICPREEVCSGSWKMSEEAGTNGYANAEHTFFFTPAGGKDAAQTSFLKTDDGYCNSGNLDNVLSYENETIALHIDTANINQLWDNIDYTQENVFYLNYHLVSNDGICNVNLDSAVKITVRVPEEPAEFWVETIIPTGTATPPASVLVDDGVANFCMEQLNGIFQLKVTAKNANGAELGHKIFDLSQSYSVTSILPFAWDFDDPGVVWNTDVCPFDLAPINVTFSMTPSPELRVENPVVCKEGILNVVGIIPAEQIENYNGTDELSLTYELCYEDEANNTDVKIAVLGSTPISNLQTTPYEDDNAFYLPNADLSSLTFTNGVCSDGFIKVTIENLTNPDCGATTPSYTVPVTIYEPIVFTEPTFDDVDFCLSGTDAPSITLGTVRVPAGLNQQFKVRIINATTEDTVNMALDAFPPDVDLSRFNLVAGTEYDFEVHVWIGNDEECTAYQTGKVVLRTLPQISSVDYKRFCKEAGTDITAEVDETSLLDGYNYEYVWTVPQMTWQAPYPNTETTTEANLTTGPLASVDEQTGALYEVDESEQVSAIVRIQFVDMPSCGSDENFTLTVSENPINATLSAELMAGNTFCGYLELNLNANVGAIDNSDLVEGDEVMATWMRFPMTGDDQSGYTRDQQNGVNLTTETIDAPIDGEVALAEYVDAFTNPEGGAYNYGLYLQATGFNCPAVEVNSAEFVGAGGIHTELEAENLFICEGGAVNIHPIIEVLDNHDIIATWYKDGVEMVTIHGTTEDYRNNPAYFDYIEHNVPENTADQLGYEYKLNISAVASGQQVNDNACATNELYAHAFVGFDPHATLIAPASVEVGEEATFTANVSHHTSAGETPAYRWTINGVDVDGEATNVLTYTFDAAGTFDVDVHFTGLYGCDALGSTSIDVVTPAPEVVTPECGVQIFQENAPVATVNVGIYGTQRTQTLEARPDADGAYTYQWYFNGNAIAGATNNTYETPNNLAVGHYNVSVVMTNTTDGCIAEAFVNVVVADAITVSVDGPEAACEGDVVVLRATIENDAIGYTHIQWRLNGEPLQDDDIFSGTQTTELTIQVSAEGYVTGEYAFEVVRPGCENTYGYHNFDIFEAPVVNVVATALCSNEATLTANVDGAVQPIKYVWYRINQTTPEPFNPPFGQLPELPVEPEPGTVEPEPGTVVIIPVLDTVQVGETFGNEISVDQAGSYYVEAVYANSNCNAISSLVEVEEGVVTQFTATASQNSVCDGAQVTLSANVPAGATADASTTYQWYMNGVAVPGATMADFTTTLAYTPNTATSSYVFYVGIGGQTSCPATSQSAIVNVEPSLNVVIDGYHYVCENNQIYLEAIVNHAIGEGDLDYVWYEGNLPVTEGSTYDYDTIPMNEQEYFPRQDAQFRIGDILYTLNAEGEPRCDENWIQNDASVEYPVLLAGTQEIGDEAIDGDVKYVLYDIREDETTVDGEPVNDTNAVDIVYLPSPDLFIEEEGAYFERVFSQPERCDSIWRDYDVNNHFFYNQEFPVYAEEFANGQPVVDGKNRYTFIAFEGQNDAGVLIIKYTHEVRTVVPESCEYPFQKYEITSTPGTTTVIDTTYIYQTFSSEVVCYYPYDKARLVGTRTGGLPVFVANTSETEEQDDFYAPREEPYHFTVRVNNAFGCVSESAPFDVVVRPVPAAQIVFNNNTICDGGLIEATAQLAGLDVNEADFAWTINGTALPFNSASISVPALPQEGDEIEVAVTITDRLTGCPVVVEATLNISRPVVEVQNHGNYVLCSGEQLLLTATTSNDEMFGQPHFQWFRNGQQIAGATSATIIDAPMSTNAAATIYEYSVLVNYPAAACHVVLPDSELVAVAVVNNPYVVISGNNNVCAGSPLELTANVNPEVLGGIDYTYSWYVNGVKLADQDNSVLVIDSLPASTNEANGVHKFVAVINEGTACQAASHHLDVTAPEAPAIHLALSSNVICMQTENEITATVIVENGNVNDFTYQWTMNDTVDMPFYTSSINFMPESSSVLTEDIAVTATHVATGCEATTAATIYRISGGVEVVANIAGEICEGTQVVLTTELPEIEGDNQLPRPNFQWYVNGQTIAGANAPFLTVTPQAINGMATQYNYAVSVSYPNISCVAIDTLDAPFVVKPAPVVVISGNNNVCAGNTLTLTANTIHPVGDTTIYAWHMNGQLLESDSNVLVIEEIESSMSELNGVHTIVAILKPGSACEARDIVHVTASAAPTVEVTVSRATICEAGTLHVTAHVRDNSNQNLHYGWTKNDEELPYNTASFDYVVNEEDSAIVFEVMVAQEQSGCITTAISDTINPVDVVAPKVEVTLVTANNDSVICEGAEVGMYAVLANADELGEPTYQWYANGQEIPGATTRAYFYAPTTYHNDAAEYLYSVRVQFQDQATGCALEDFAPKHITVKASPVVVITGDNVVCEGEDLELIAHTIHATQDGSITWYQNGQPFDAINDTLVIEAIEGSSNLANGVHTFVAVYDENNACQATSQIFYVTVNEAPEVTVTANTDKVCVGGEIVFTANLVDNTVSNVNYQWCYSDSTPIHGAVYSTYAETFTAAASSQIMVVKVTQVGSGCVAYAQKQYTVYDDPTITISADVADLCVGAGVQLNAEIAGGVSNLNETYVWKVNGQTINGVDGDNYYAIMPVAGQYTFSVMMTQTANNFVSGCATTLADMLINVHPQPEVYINTNGMIDVCEGGTTQLGTSYYADDALMVGAHYEWRRNGTREQGDAPTIQTMNSLAAGDYTYTVRVTTDVRGCNAVSDMIHTRVVKDPSWSRNVVTATEVCEGTEVNLYAQVQDGLGGTIQWFVADSATAAPAAVGQGGFTIDVPDAGEHVYYPTFSAFGDGCDLANGNPTIVTVYERPTATAETVVDSDIICLGESADIEVSFTGAAPYTYSLKNMMTGAEVVYTTNNNPDTITVYPTETTIYEIQSLSNGICEAYANAASAIVPVVVSHIEFTDAIFAAGCDTVDQTAYLTFDVISGGGAAQSTYEVWTYDGIFVADGRIVGNFIPVDIAQFPAGDHDFVVIIDECEYPVTIRKNILSSIVEQRWDDVLVCNNNSANNGGYTFVSYQWYKNGAPIEGATGQYYNEIGGLNGEYYLWMKDASGIEYWSCPQIFSREVSISVYPNPANVEQEIIIELPLTVEELEGGVLDIYDAKGALVQHISVLEPITKVQGFKAQGAYFGRILTGTNDVKTVKFIIVK